MTTAINFTYRPEPTATIKIDNLSGQKVFHLFINNRYQETFLDRLEAEEAKEYHLEELKWMRHFI